MKVYHSLNNLPNFQNTHISIGTFDGVHAGHRELIRRMVLQANENHRESIIITFHPHPRTLVNANPGNLKLLNSVDEKIAILNQTGVNHLIITPFNQTFSEQTAQEYIENFLINCFHPEHITIGYDHRFGKNRTGGIELLKTYANQGSFMVDEIPEQQVNEMKVSSTQIRQLLESGNIKEANVLLGAPYPIMGTVVKGRQQGRLLGFPTANIQSPEPLKLIPSYGVYGTYVFVDGQQYKGALNIGVNPSFGLQNQSIEVHILNFDQDIYNQQIELKLICKIREEIKFPNLEALKSHIAEDIQLIDRLLP